jgi:hypothetical protein
MEISDDKLIKLAKSIADQVCHIQPTQKTIEMFEELDKKTNHLQKSLDSIGNKLDLQVQRTEHLNEKMLLMLDNHQKSNDEMMKLLQKGIQDEEKKREEDYKNLKYELSRKADSWVEVHLKKATWIIVSLIITAIVFSVVKK